MNWQVLITKWSRSKHVHNTPAQHPYVHMPKHPWFDFTKKPTLTTSCEVECELFSDHLESKQFHLSLPLWPVRWSSSQCGHRSQSRATWLKVVGSGGTWQTKELRLVGFYIHVATQTMKNTWLLGIHGWNFGTLVRKIWGIYWAWHWLNFGTPLGKACGLH